MVIPNLQPPSPIPSPLPYPFRHHAELRFPLLEPPSTDPTPPNPSDCHRVLAHLPTSYNSIYPSIDAGAESRMAAASPFFPIGQMSHDTCSIQFVAHNASGNGPWLVDPQPLTAAAIMKTWNRMGDRAERIISQCADHRRIGSAHLLVDE